MKISIVYSSKTGNTKMLARAAYDYLSANNEIAYYGEPAKAALKADLILIGFWTDKGTADDKSLELIREVGKQSVFIYGTAGFGGSKEYFNNILRRVEASLSDEATVVGDYMCQGKMPISVRERYVSLKNSNASIPNIDGMIENFDKALKHPSKLDIELFLNKLDKLMGE